MRTERLRHRLPLLLLVLILACAAGAPPAAASAGEEPPAPRVIPLPAPPPGPAIRRVSHDAGLRALSPGDRLRVTVETAPRATVTAALGSIGATYPCAPSGTAPGTFTCEIVLPEGSAGTHRVRAHAVDAEGRASTLSASLPVTVVNRPPWKETDSLNVRLAPALFAHGSAELDAASRAVLAADLDLLKTHAGFPILLEGRCDRSEPGDLKALSARRAEAVREELAVLGIPGTRVRVAALADSQPLTASRDESERAVNRSVLVLFEPLPAAR